MSDSKPLAASTRAPSPRSRNSISRPSGPRKDLAKISTTPPGCARSTVPPTTHPLDTHVVRRSDTPEGGLSRGPPSPVHPRRRTASSGPHRRHGLMDLHDLPLRGDARHRRGATHARSPRRTGSAPAQRRIGRTVACRRTRSKRDGCEGPAPRGHRRRQGNIMTRGIPTTAGSRILGAFRRMTRSFGNGFNDRATFWEDEPGRFAMVPTRTRHSDSSIPSTRSRRSSGGSAAAVAARMAPAALDPTPAGRFASPRPSAAWSASNPPRVLALRTHRLRLVARQIGDHALRRGRVLTLSPEPARLDLCGPRPQIAPAARPAGGRTSASDCRRNLHP